MLNEEQKRAVECIEGPLRIVAGPGTGKTHTLVARIFYIIEKARACAENILTLTFTHKAAHELKERLKEAGFEGVCVTTFHGLAAMMLRRFWERDFKILGETEAIETVKNFLVDDELTDCENIYRAICELRSASILEKNKENGVDDNTARVRELCKSYEQELMENKALDFEGLLIELVKLLKDRAMSERWRYVMVDEFQDVNLIQMEIVRLLAAAQGNICVVGDSNQTIYSWRGANPRSMQDFLKIFPQAETVYLKTNYRNTPEILRAAGNLIKANKCREDFDFEAISPSGSGVFLWQSNYESEFEAMLTGLFERIFGSHDAMHRADALDCDHLYQARGFGDVAILFRSLEEGRRIRGFLENKGYPWIMSSGETFWQNSFIKVFLEELKLLKDIGQFPEGLSFAKWMAVRLEEFSTRQKLSERKKVALWRLMPYFWDFDSLSLAEGLEKFLDISATAGSAESFIDCDRINLLTLHSAKGLEFPIVIVIGLEEGHFPHRKSLKNVEFLEEERRLFYVGMTRAREELHLFSCRRQREKIYEPSRFLNEIGEEFLVKSALPSARILSLKKKEMKKAQMRLF